MLPFLKRYYTSLDERHPTFTKVGRFLVSGGISTGTDLALLYAFTDIFRIWYLLSSVLAFILAFIVSFLLQKFWTFRDMNKSGMSAQMGAYFFIAVCNLGLNTFQVYLGVDLLGLHYLIAQALASLIIAVSSFFIYQRFVFKTL